MRCGVDVCPLIGATATSTNEAFFLQRTRLPPYTSHIQKKRPIFDHRLVFPCGSYDTISLKPHGPFFPNCKSKGWTCARETRGFFHSVDGHSSFDDEEAELGQQAKKVGLACNPLHSILLLRRRSLLTCGHAYRCCSSGCDLVAWLPGYPGRPELFDGLSACLQSYFLT